MAPLSLIYNINLNEDWDSIRDNLIKLVSKHNETIQSEEESFVAGQMRPISSETTKISLKMRK